MKNKLIILLVGVVCIVVSTICVYTFTNNNKNEEKDEVKNIAENTNKDEKKNNIKEEKEPKETDAEEDEETDDEDWKEIEIEEEDRFYDTTEIDKDINNDDEDEIININTDKKEIEINSKKFFEDDEEMGYRYSYIIIDIDFDDEMEIIQRASYEMISPITNTYTIYKYKKNKLKEIAEFSIIGNMPDTIYSNKKSIKFEYHPYESPDDLIEEKVVDLK